VKTAFVQGALSTATEVDDYTFTASPGDVLTVSSFGSVYTEGTTNEVLTQLEVVDPFGSIVFRPLEPNNSALVKFSKGGASFNYTTGNDAYQPDPMYVNLPLVVGGSYRIRVSAGKVSGSASDPTGNYHVVAYLQQSALVDVENRVLRIVGDAGNDTISVNKSGTNLIVNANDTVSTVPQADVDRVEVELGRGDDVFTATASVAVPIDLRAGDGHDTVVGGSGADRLEGGLGDDSITGGVGNDTFVYSAARAVQTDSLPDNDDLGDDTITESASGGQDYIEISGTIGGDVINLGMTGADLEITIAGDVTTTSYANIEKVVVKLHDGTPGGVFVDVSDRFTVSYTATLPVQVFGAAGADSIAGGKGNDVLEGSYGNDTLAGGNGDDVYVYKGRSIVLFDTFSENDSFGTDTVVEGVNGGQDLIDLSLAATRDIVNGVTTWYGADFYFGLNTNQRVIGTAAKPVLTLTRLDTVRLEMIHGTAVSDTIHGDANDNFMKGMGGNDYLWGDDGTDIMEGNEGMDFFNGDGGVDYILAEDEELDAIDDDGLDVIYADEDDWIF
jgi:Ca2+-binding RTX toxin-like protein